MKPISRMSAQRTEYFTIIYLLVTKPPKIPIDHLQIQAWYARVTGSKLGSKAVCIYSGPLPISPFLCLGYIHVYGSFLPPMLPAWPRKVPLFAQTLKACTVARSLPLPVLGNSPGPPYSPAESACQISKSEAGPWEPGSGGGRDSLGRPKMFQLGGALTGNEGAP